MADKLTLKQERFAWEYTRNGGNASQAYRDVYACNGSSADTIAKRAHELRHDGKIAGRIDRLEQEQQRVARLDRNSVLGMLLATYDKAVQCDQTGPAAPVCGIDREGRRRRHVHRPAPSRSGRADPRAIDRPTCGRRSASQEDGRTVAQRAAQLRGRSQPSNQEAIWINGRWLVQPSRRPRSECPLLGAKRTFAR